MITTQFLSNIRTLGFGLAGLICGGYAFAALLLEHPETLPHWLPIAAGLVVAAVIFIAAGVAGPRTTRAALDESYHNDRRTAAALGFWVALGTGVFLWLSGLGNGMELAITLTFSAAVCLLAQVWLDVRGHA